MRNPFPITTKHNRRAPQQGRRENRFIAVSACAGLMLLPAVAVLLLCGADSRRPTQFATSALRQGVVNADDFESLQAAVDALAPAGGVVQLSSKTYALSQPLAQVPQYDT